MAISLPQFTPHLNAVAVAVVIVVVVVFVVVVTSLYRENIYCVAICILQSPPHLNAALTRQGFHDMSRQAQIA